MITERLLQYLWESAAFSREDLRALDGQSLQIIQKGIWNKNQGPDFILASIKIGPTVWVGNIEMHVKSSGWFQHAHQNDKQYKNVILHVVWEQEPRAPDIPTLELKSRVSPGLIRQYEELMRQPENIACSAMLHQVGEHVWDEWKAELLRRRMMKRASYIGTLLQMNHSHWEEVNWWMLARAFGMPVNTEAFEQIARSLPLNILLRESHQPLHAEALLMGQAGMLDAKMEEGFPSALQEKFLFLQRKYRLRKPALQLKLLRMRPAAFPGIRLSQLAEIISGKQRLLKSFREAESVYVLKQLLDVNAAEYWNTHYRFGEETAFRKKKTGGQLLGLVVLNAIAPMVFCYGVVHRDKEACRKSLEWLRELPAEQNRKTEIWKKFGVANKNAGDSQALLELTNEFCQPKKCLECAIARCLIS